VVVANDPPALGHTEANKVLERLLALPDGDLRNALGIAREYYDNSAVAGVQGLPAGKRLMIQIEFGLQEMEAVRKAPDEQN
jgi:hypothetical protein